MRTVMSLALAAIIAAPAIADDGFEPSEHRAFRRAMYDANLAPTRLAFRLWRCNVAASKKVGAERKGIDLFKLPIEDEAAEALASCTAEVEALAQDVPTNAKNVEAMKAAIVRANVETIKETRNPPTVVCAYGPAYNHPCGGTKPKR